MRVRSKWYRVNVTLHQLPGVDLGEQAYIVSSDNKRTGSPQRGKIRTFLRFTLLAAANRGKRPVRWQAVIQAAAQA